MKTMMTIASLVGLVIVCGSLAAQPKEPKLPDGAWQKPVVGVGVTQDKAKDDALSQAARIVGDLMREQTPPLQAFKVDKDYVKSLLAGSGVPGKDDEFKIAGQKDLPIKRWIVTFRTDTNWWRDVVQRDYEAQRQLVSEDRQSLAGKIMIGLAVLLLTGFGYVQADDYTKRRFTPWLRFVAVALATTVAAGWLWFILL